VEEKEKQILEYNEKANAEGASLLDKRDLESMAQNLRFEIDDGRVGREKRKERQSTEQEKLDIEISAMEKEEAEATDRLDVQSAKIEAFKNEELGEDRKELSLVETQRLEIEQMEEGIMERAEQEEEEALAASGGIVTGEGGGITERGVEVTVVEGKELVACDRPGKNRNKWTSDPYVVVSLVKREVVVEEGGGEEKKAEEAFTTAIVVKNENDEKEDAEPGSVPSPPSPSPPTTKYKSIPFESFSTNPVKKTLNPKWSEKNASTLGQKKAKGVLAVDLNKVWQPVLECKVMDSDFGRDEEVSVV